MHLTPPSYFASMATYKETWLLLYENSLDYYTSLSSDSLY